ncbi:branched-chain amino acid aminotransferase [Bacillus sp. ISL-40]|uniref:branched-chain amino acid aminotransferase n=1 Tax=unclassified Bacillus (in: firmicutes) TaxID=185979 RepID=UPI001BEB50C5|nr:MULTISPECIES: branched-chain amino acid aminotransferase [unclassified Bacillus (in: firmicutes)]MBT2696483.1 branched-chain amino acid aminotransferase [Bacillus sp. ISL-40]MBT2723152.1 branched-chain amino acid aminotransferase [Bacillus sp. ISL-46]MBT2741501.1 branched-chain amino acid aminotransferase [Bacillus sp. ISL-77]
MLKDQIKQYISEQQNNPNGNSITIFKEEKEYLEKNQLGDNIQFAEKDVSVRFADAYIERCDKETENMLKNESSSFLTQPLDYLKMHKNEFIYLESNWFDLIGVEAVSLEADDVFGTYDVMLGLKLQKKFEKALKENLNTQLHGDEAKFDLMFSLEDGLWNLNFALNYVEGFNEEISIGEAFQLIYSFLFQLVEAVEGERK